MKKFIPVLAVALMATVAFTSCSKKGTYTCSCTDVTVSGTTITPTPQTFTDVKKSDAEKTCTALQATYSGQGLSTTCTIK